MSLLNTLFKKRHEQKTNQESSNAQTTKIVKPPTAVPVKRKAPTPLDHLLVLSNLNDEEKSDLKGLLEKYASENSSIETDLKSLVSITSEIKAINNQAIILHGERVARAQKLLKPYKEGVFTAWLVATYGNRQTPYNFLQYYSFYQKLPSNLRDKLEKMPRQAIYTLASRDGDFKNKVELVKTYAGQSKQQLIKEIRTTFPLDQGDKRRQKSQEHLVHSLNKIYDQLKEETNLSVKNRDRLREALKNIESIID